MSSLENFLTGLRYHPAVRALVPVDVSMGIPVKIRGEMLYVPFFRYIRKNQCRLVCELLVSYPSREIYAYQKISDGREIIFDEDKLFALKKELLAGAEGLKSRREIPQELAELYLRILEGEEYDKYTGDA